MRISLLRGKHLTCLLFSSLLLISSSSILAAPETPYIGIEAITPCVAAHAKDTIYYYQITNTFEQDYSALFITAQEYLSKNVMRLTPTPEDIKAAAAENDKFDKNATACQFYPHLDDLKAGQSCLVKFKFDAADLVAGDKIDINTIWVVALRKAPVVGHSYSYATNLSETAVTVESIPGSLSFQAEGMVDDEWTISDDGQEYTLTVGNDSEDPSSEIDSVAIDPDVWNSADLDSFRAYFGNEAPAASLGCTLVTSANPDNETEPCTFTFKADKDAVGRLAAPLSAKLSFTSSNANAKSLTVNVINHGTLGFEDEGTVISNWQLDNDGSEQVLTVINPAHPNATITYGVVENVTIDPNTWKSAELATFRAYFGDEAPTASKGCKFLPPGSAACTFTFRHSGKPPAKDAAPLSANVTFSAGNTLSQSLKITVAKSPLRLHPDGQRPVDSGPALWIIHDDASTDAIHGVTIENTGTKTLENVEVTQKSWSKTNSKFRAYFSNKAPESDDCKSIAAGKNCLLEVIHASSPEISVTEIEETLHIRSSLGTKLLTVRIQHARDQAAKPLAKR